MLLPAAAADKYHPDISLSWECIATPPAQTCSTSVLGFCTFLARQGRWTLVLSRAVSFRRLPLIPSVLHCWLGQQPWLPQYVAACSEPQPTPHPQALLLSLTARRCSPSSSDRGSQESAVPSVSIPNKGCLVWNTLAAKLMLKKSMRSYDE